MADWYRPDLRITKLVARTVQQSEVRIQMGDDPRWAAPDWDDSTWAVVERSRLPLNAGPFWVRTRVRTQAQNESMPALLIINGGSAKDVYWDGMPAGSSGVPGNSPETERVGISELQYELSATMCAPGEHVVALRMSTYHSGKVGARFAQLLLWTVPPKALQQLGAKLDLLPAMGVGAMMTIGLTALVMWVVADRRLILALFSALCLSSALLVAVASASHIWTYPASWEYLQSAGRIIMVVIVASLSLATAIVHLCPLPRRAWLLVPFILEAGIAFYYLPLNVNVLTALLWRVGFVSALVFCGWAMWRRRQGAWMLFVGFAATYALFERDPKHFDQTNFFLCFLPSLIGLITCIALSLRQARLQARDTKLTAARLEIELLKKSLQPHFLMNTLTALSQVIEEKPAAAVQLIDDLAVEFRSLARFSGQKQVSIAEELALCRAHLGVMSARTNLPWNLQADGIDVTASVPPALFLTLIENGFSHQRAPKNETTFTLRAELMRDRVRYTFLSPGVVTSEANRTTGGTGLRYVCARLEESFHDAWNLTQGAVPGGWETVIDLLHPRPNEAGV